MPYSGIFSNLPEDLRLGPVYLGKMHPNIFSMSPLSDSAGINPTGPDEFRLTGESKNKNQFNISSKT